MAKLGNSLSSGNDVPNPFVHNHVPRVRVWTLVQLQRKNIHRANIQTSALRLCHCLRECHIHEIDSLATAQYRIWKASQDNELRMGAIPLTWLRRKLIAACLLHFGCYKDWSLGE